MAAALQPIYAGIGARSAPPDILSVMTTMAEWLERHEWRLATGGAAGADAAFAAGASPEARTVYLPWRGYNGWNGPDVRLPSRAQEAQWAACAKEHHPAWERCSQGARRLHARNAAILLGADLNAPVAAVVAWTPGGRVEGGTGMGLRIADAHGIPALNLGLISPREACERLRDIRVGWEGAAPATGHRNDAKPFGP